MKKLTHYSFFITLFLVDRLTKYLALTLLAKPYVVSSFVSFELGFNRGITGGIMHSSSSFIFGGVSLVTLFVILLLFSHTVHAYKLGIPIHAQTMILAGALSNLFDRMWFGGVVDFIKLSYAGWTWPLFNVADILIVCGAFLLLVQGVRK